MWYAASSHMKAKVAQLCPTLCNPKFSKLEYWSGSRSLPQRIFPTQGSNPGLPHCRWILNTGVDILSLLQGIFLTQGSPALQMDSLPAKLPGKPICIFKFKFWSSVKFQKTLFCPSYSFYRWGNSNKLPAQHHMKS